MATEHLSGCGVRHPEPPVLVLVRAEPGVDAAPTPISRRSSAYLESVADDFDLRRHLMLNTAVRSMRWNARRVALGRGPGQTATPVVADVVVSAVGLFGAARYPDIDGLADFAGTLMHTARWDATVDLTGKRVAVIGTGASGVQVVPELADIADELTVFQRTPPWMVPKEDRPYSAEELARYRRLPWASWRERWRLWKLQHDNTALTPDHPRMAVVQELSEGFLRKYVADDGLRDALTPRYPFRCKRVLLGEKYYTALQRDHVDLVTDPIDRVTETAIVTADGAAVEVDAIVLATGFETSSYLSGLDVIGVDGESLHERWGSDPQAYLGTAVSGFPNFFMLYGPNTNQGANSIIYILEAGARLVASAVSRLARRAASSTSIPTSSVGSTTRSPRNWNRRSGRDATATTDRRPGASSRNGPIRNSTMRGRHGDYGHATGYTVAREQRRSRPRC